MAPKKSAPVTYLLRDVDAHLWARFKARAGSQAMRATLLQLVAAYADGAVVVEHSTTVSTPRKRARG